VIPLSTHLCLHRNKPQHDKRQRTIVDNQTAKALAILSKFGSKVIEILWVYTLAVTSNGYT